MPNTLFAGQGRPRKDDAARRKGVFLTLMAEGHDAVTARKRAGINPDRALRIVTESDFRAILQALRDGAGPVAVILDPDAGKVAA